MCSDNANSNKLVSLLKKTSFWTRGLCFLSSWVICALAQPHKGWLFCALASFLGLGLFFSSLSLIKGKKRRFFAGFIWFFSLQCVLLLWLATPEYQGYYVYFLLTLLCSLLGLQFGLFTWLVPTCRQELSMPKILFLSALWTLLEWSRLFFLCGFIWNPLGLTLTATPYLAQLASLTGVYGLSFLVMLCNLLFYKAVLQKKTKAAASWVVATAFPLVFSFCYIFVQSPRLEQQADSTLKIALVQTSIYPPEKNFFYKHQEAYINPYLQWKRIVDILKQKKEESFDLIVLPEAAVPFSA